MIDNSLEEGCSSGISGESEGTPQNFQQMIFPEDCPSPKLSHDYAKARTYASPKVVLSSPHKNFSP